MFTCFAWQDSKTQQRCLYQSLGTPFFPRYFFSPWRSQTRSSPCQNLATCHQNVFAQGSYLTGYMRSKQSQLKDKAILQLFHFYFNKAFKAFVNLLFRTKGKRTHVLDITQHGTSSVPCYCILHYTKPQQDHFMSGPRVGTYSELRNHLFPRHL